MAEPEPNPYAPPAAPQQAPQSTQQVLVGTSSGQLTLAGILLAVNAALALTERVVTSRPAGSNSPATGIGPVVIDGLIAASFLRGSDKYRGFAIFRVCAGFVVFSVINATNGDYLTPISMAIGYSGLLLVMVGRPTRARMIAGTAMFGLLVMLDVAALFFIHTSGV